MQNASFAIPHASGKHSGKLLKRSLDAVAFERGQHYLGVAVAAEAMTFGYKSRPQTAEIIDLAVERHDQAFVGRQHRLMTGGGEINDRKATMAESDAAVAVEPDALAIRPAMSERRGHRMDCREMAGVRCAGEENADDTTHLITSIVESVTPCDFPQQPGRLRLQVGTRPTAQSPVPAAGPAS